jgi:hypothetical protein
MPSQGYTSAAKQFPLGYFKVPECGGVMDPPGRIRVDQRTRNVSTCLNTDNLLRGNLRVKLHKTTSLSVEHSF